MEVILELSDPVVMQSKHTMSRLFHKILATGRPVSKILIEYNSNSLEENDEEEMEPIDIKQKTCSYNDENACDFKWWDVQL